MTPAQYIVAIAAVIFGTSGLAGLVATLAGRASVRSQIAKTDVERNAIVTEDKRKTQEWIQETQEWMAGEMNRATLLAEARGREIDALRVLIRAHDAWDVLIYEKFIQIGNALNKIEPNSVDLNTIPHPPPPLKIENH